MRMPKVGQTAYIKPTQGESLRNGWGRFLPVTVVSIGQEGLRLIRVRDSGGYVDDIHHFQLDCGCDFHWPGRGWLPESHPDALRYVRTLLAEPPHENSTLERGHDGYQRWLRHILARNGAEVPASN